MFNVVLFILGYFLTRKDGGKSGRPDDNETSGGSGISSKTWDRIVLGGLAIAAYFVFRSSFNKYSQQQAFENIASNPNALIAQQFKSAFEPYFVLFGFAPGTDTDALFSLAGTIKDWKGVISSYQQLYTENLTDRLQKELNRTDLVEFYRLLGQGAVTTSPTGPNTTAGQSGATNTPGAKPSTGQYRLPGLREIAGEGVYMLSGHYAIFRDSNGKVEETIAPGQRLGEALGWEKVAGRVMVVYYKSNWEKLIFKARNIDANTVQLK